MGAVIILVIGGLLSAVLIVPRQREMRRHQAVVAGLHVGDQVMTGAGLYGTITELQDDLAWLEIAPGVTVKVARRAIASQVEVSNHDADGLAG
jgi:preprotein translocase subunit YajC